MSTLSEAPSFEPGTMVTHVLWGRHGTVESVRALARPQKGSRWMIRVRWDDGGWGTDGNANFARRTL